MWTLVGAGLKSFEETSKPMANVIPPKSTWIKERVSHIAPDENAVFTTSDQKVKIDLIFRLFFMTEWKLSNEINFIFVQAQYFGAKG